MDLSSLLLAQFESHTRLYALEAAEPINQLMVERWQGHESLSEGFEWQVLGLSTDTHLPLSAMLGQAVTLSTTLADGTRYARTGLVRDAECLGADGGLARYRLSLVPWTWLLSQSRHSRVFQDKSVRDIVEQVFQAYVPLAAWTWADEIGPFLDGTPPRTYCVQYRETDLDFVQRLLAEEGIGWRIETHAESSSGHRVVLFADSAQVPEEISSISSFGGMGLRFHRAGSQEDQDAIQALGRERKLSTHKLAWLSHHTDSNHAITATLPLAAAPGRDLEDYDAPGVSAFADSEHAERLANHAAQAIEARRDYWQGRSSVRSFTAGHWFALTQAPSDLDTEVTPEFLITSVHHVGINNLPKALLQKIAESLGDASNNSADDSVNKAVEAKAEHSGYANRFEALIRSHPWRPLLSDGTGMRMNPRPTAPGPQTAIVVGPNGETAPLSTGPLYCDGRGRIHVRFHWQRGETPDDQRSCWLRVAQRYAGPGVGSQFLPRIGQEVLVDFLEGDIDQPLVIGALYNGQGEGGIAPTTGGQAGAEVDSKLFSQAADLVATAQANLAGGHSPAWHGASADADGHRNAAALSGMKSLSFSGTGHNQLVFDDSDEQGRIQMATTQSASQLNMGHLIHQSDNFRGSFRGEGFELRTDAWGALRAPQGLLLTTYDQSLPGAAGDMTAGNALLKQAQATVKAYSDAAKTHLTVPLASHLGAAKANASKLLTDKSPLAAFSKIANSTVSAHDYTAALADTSKGKASNEKAVPHVAEGVLAMTARGGQTTIAGQSMQWAVGETITLASGKHSELAVAEQLRWHSGQAIGWLAGAEKGAASDGLKIIAGNLDVTVQAQHDVIKLQSKDQLTISSAQGEATFAAGKKIHLAVSGGASITIEGGNITFACPGTITVNASKKSFVAATQLKQEMRKWGESEIKGKRLISFSG
jgi:type VI secretion system secreted protein VgrG